LVPTTHGYTVEKNLQQYVLGANYYIDGFNQMIAVDVSWLYRNLDGISPSEAAAAGITNYATSTSSQNDYRFRVMYQFRF